MKNTIKELKKQKADVLAIFEEVFERVEDNPDGWEGIEKNYEKLYSSLEKYRMRLDKLVPEADRFLEDEDLLSLEDSDDEDEFERIKDEIDLLMESLSDLEWELDLFLGEINSYEPDMYFNDEDEAHDFGYSDEDLEHFEELFGYTCGFASRE